MAWKPSNKEEKLQATSFLSSSFFSHIQGSHCFPSNDNFTTSSLSFSRGVSEESQAFLPHVFTPAILQALLLDLQAMTTVCLNQSRLLSSFLQRLCLFAWRQGACPVISLRVWWLFSLYVGVCEILCGTSSQIDKQKEFCCVNLCV